MAAACQRLPPDKGFYLLMSFSVLFDGAWLSRNKRITCLLTYKTISMHRNSLSFLPIPYSAYLAYLISSLSVYCILNGHYRAFCYSAPVGERSFAISLSACLCVCLSASISLKPLDRSSRTLSCRYVVTVGRSSSGGVAIRYVLPVL